MKSNLYTGTGDEGMTSLVGGKRISKTAPRLESYGTIDELSSFIGVVIASQGTPEYLQVQMIDIQNRLFDLGSYLATEVPTGQEPACKSISEADIQAIEKQIDTLDQQTPRIKAFVLPGGCLAASHCHVARTVCRRAERAILRLAELEYVDPLLIRWINRLSDYLFIAARYINHVNGAEEIVWRRNLGKS